MKKNFWIYLILIFFVGYAIIYRITHTRVIIEFEDLEPFPHSIPVYYKGFNLGKTGKIRPAQDFKTTYVEIYIKSNELIFPINTTAIVRRKDRKDYIELIYPTSPDITKLQNNSIIKGKKGINFENFLQEQSTNGNLEILNDNINETLDSVGNTFDAITIMVETLTEILKESRPVISDTLNNINSSSKYFSDTAYNINNDIHKGEINKTLHNFNKTSENLANATCNLVGISENINNNSINLFNCLLKDISKMINNMNSLVLGVAKTLKKRFSGIRIMFGKGLSD